MTTFKKKDPMPTGYLTGKSFFARVHYPDKEYNKYVIQLALEGAELEKANKMNLKVKPASKHIPYPHVEIKRAVKTKPDGSVTKAPEVLDSMNAAIPKEIMIGNGSTVKVKFAMYEHKGKMMAYLDKVKVTKLVQFEGGRNEAADFMAVDSDGFKGVLPEASGSDEGDDMDDVPFETSPKKSPVKSKVTTTG